VDADTIVRNIWPQLRKIAENNEYVTVSRVEMKIGGGYGVDAAAIQAGFDRIFEGSCFDGAAVSVSILPAGQEYQPPGRSDRAVASGWEFLITSIVGRK